MQTLIIHVALSFNINYSGVITHVHTCTHTHTHTRAHTPQSVPHVHIRMYIFTHAHVHRLTIENYSGVSHIHSHNIMFTQTVTLLISTYMLK